MELNKALRKLYSLHAFGVKLGLDNIKKFLDHIGNPQSKLKAFHIAGSNGKGSTAAFIASILQEFGYKTGLYTSPHFVKFNERIVINGKQIPDEVIAEFIIKHEKYIDDHKLTFFEVTTALAFHYFANQNVKYAVIETGLGGRLDATNVLNPLAVIITSISLEHVDILGKTISEITREKAAIIKPHCKTFTGQLPDEARIIIDEKCSIVQSQLYRIEDYTSYKKENILELYTEELQLDDWTMPLKGAYQKYNAALAALAVSKTLDLDDFNKIEQGIKNVIKNTGFQGRYEYYNQQPDIIFDSAHNPDGISNFISEFKRDSHQYNRKYLIFAALSDKNIREMLSILKEFFDEIWLTEVKIERSFKISQLLQIAEEQGINANPLHDPISFINDFRKNAGRDDCLVVTGSIYLLGEVKEGLRENKDA
jgi:dihydrofolate synthase / folylpolyglutamate synthase